MHILIVNHSPIPVYAYGGTERVIWDLAKELVEIGHHVTFLVPEGSSCNFADVQFINPNLSWEQQIPKDVEVVHFQFQPKNLKLDVPYVVTEHGNADLNVPLDLNTIFVSKNHAERHNSNCYVLNGLDWRNYGEVNWDTPKNYYHFLGKAAWRVKNVKGAINVANRAKVPLHVLGGDRFNFKRGIRLTFSSNISFHGMVGGEEKLALLQGSKGLIFPVKWHEPFGLAIIESMYFGCPVFSTPYGAIPELVAEDCGFLSANSNEHIEAIQNLKFDPMRCHQHVLDHFNSRRMAEGYLEKYLQVIDGQKLNKEQPYLIEDSQHLAWN